MMKKKTTEGKAMGEERGTLLRGGGWEVLGELSFGFQVWVGCSV